MTSSSGRDLGVRRRLLLARQAVRLSHAEVAHALRVTTTLVKRWEGGTSDPSPEHWRELCLLYGVLPCYFLFGDSTMTLDALKALSPGRWADSVR